MTRVRARLATSQAIPAYGGIRLPEEVVEGVARAVASGTVPMHFGHDISRPVRVENVEAGTERLDDGSLAAWAEFDVDEGVWNEFQQEVADAGAAGGMSISYTSPLDEKDEDVDTLIAADAHHFSDAQIRAALLELERLDSSAGGARLYQLSLEPIAKVVFDIVENLVGALGPNIAASVIYDAAKGFLRRGRKTTFNLVFRESRRGTRKLQVHIEAESDAELRAALDRLPAVLESGAKGTFAHHADGGYRQIEPGPDEDPNRPPEPD